MRWHLCNATGVSVQTCEAPDKASAMIHFGKVAVGWFVCSDASYRIGFQAFDVPSLCGKCLKRAPMGGHVKCSYCRELDRISTNKASEKRRTIERTLRQARPNEPIMTTGEIATLFRTSTRTAHSTMKRHGCNPVATFARRVGRAGRAERQWLQSDVERVQLARKSRNLRDAAIRRELARRAAKRQEATA